MPLASLRCTITQVAIQHHRRAKVIGSSENFHRFIVVPPGVMGRTDGAKLLHIQRVVELREDVRDRGPRPQHASKAASTPQISSLLPEITLQ